MKNLMAKLKQLDQKRVVLLTSIGVPIEVYTVPLPHAKIGRLENKYDPSFKFLNDDHLKELERFVVRFGNKIIERYSVEVQHAERLKESSAILELRNDKIILLKNKKETFQIADIVTVSTMAKLYIGPFTLLNGKCAFFIYSPHLYETVVEASQLDVYPSSKKMDVQICELL